MHDKGHPISVQNRDPDGAREQCPEIPGLHGRCRNGSGAEGCAELWIGLVAGGDQVIIDIAALVDCPERQQ